LLVATLLAAGCIPEDYGDAPFACAVSGFCPEGYFCGPDKICHREGTTFDVGSTDGPLQEAGVPWDSGADLPGPGPDVFSPPLFEDHFSSAPGGLTQTDGTGSWSVTGGVLSQSQCYAGPEAVVPGKSWTNVKVTAKLRGNTVCPEPGYPGAVGLSVRVVSIGMNCEDKRYYYCMVDLDASNGELFAGKMDGDYNCDPSGFTSQPAGKLALGVWYTMSLSAVGNLLTCLLSGPGLGPITATLTDTGQPLASGSAGVVSDLATVSFDDFVVVAQ
jgi:hypothetical protein